MLATINVPYTGGWQNWITLSVTATLPAGQQSLQLYCTANHWNINWLELLPPATGSGGFNGSGAYHIEAEDFIAQNGTLLENCQDAGGTYNIGSINTGDWLDYRVNMPVGGSYQLSVRAASANSGANTVQLLSATGTVLATLNVSNTGSYQTFATYTANVSLPAGVQTLRLAVTGGYMAVNWLELAAPNSTVPLDNYALVLNNNFNYTGGMVYEAENTFTVEFMVKPKVAHEIDVESTSGFSGTEGQKYVMFPVHGGSEADSRAGMGISVGTNGVSVYEHADGYMPALLVWAYPIDTVWTHVAVVYHNGKPSLYINGVWKKDGLQSLKQHVYPGTQFPGGYYGSQGDGILDEVRIWSVVRTEAQIAANKDGELTGLQTGLVGYWPMNEGTGLVLHDVSGSGRDVDLTSAGYTSASWTNGRYSVASIIGSYRYAFNGKELDKDIGEDDYDYGARIYDARIGRWLSLDFFSALKPGISGYNFVSNDPISRIDPDGNYDVDPKASDREKKALTAIGDQYSQYLKDLQPGRELNTLLNRSGYKNQTALISAWDRKGAGSIMLRFSTHNESDARPDHGHEKTGATGRDPYYLHPDGLNTTDGAVATGSGVVGGGGTITFAKTILSFQETLSSKSWVIPALSEKGENTAFDYAAMAAGGYAYLNRVIGHEFTHVGADVNNMSASVVGFPNSYPGWVKTEGSFSIFGIQYTLYHRGDVFESEAYLKAVVHEDIEYGFAVNVYFRLLGGADCSVRKHSMILKTTENNPINQAIWNYIRSDEKNLRSFKPNGKYNKGGWNAINVDH